MHFSETDACVLDCNERDHDKIKRFFLCMIDNMIKITT